MFLIRLLIRGYKLFISPVLHWLGGPGVRHERDQGTDTDAYDDGAASLTPLLLDLTSPGQNAFVQAIAMHVAETRS